LKNLIDRIAKIENALKPVESKPTYFIIVDGKEVHCHGETYASVDEAKQANPGGHWLFKVVDVPEESA
jgi:hypothetical protein